MVAVLLSEVMPLKSQLSKTKKRNNTTTQSLEKILLKLLAITVIRRAIILEIILS